MPLFEWGCFWHSTCLKPTYSLRRQLLISFGVTGIVTTSLVILLACYCAISAGTLVQEEARQFLGREVFYSISNSSLYAAETFSQELDHLRGTVSLLVEIVRDRIAGYPRDGWDDDLFVPFATHQDPDVRQYPLQSPLLPRDWNVQPNVNVSNYREHLQELFDLLQPQHGSDHQIVPHDVSPRLSTASATFSFQGNCDPSVTDPAVAGFYPRCTDANNNGTTGGTVWPTTTSAGLEQKAADIGTLLKPIWESRADLLFIAVHFVNQGAGATVSFPSFVHPNEPHAYVSVGCDWMHQHVNPKTKRPFLTEDQTAHCHPAGTWVSRREFNPMEQDYCRDQALHPDETRFHGPILDQFFAKGGLETHHDHFDEDHPELYVWVVRVGRAIFDRHTGELIGCLSVKVLTNRWTSLMIETLAVQNYSSAVLVRADDGVVVAGADWSVYNRPDTTHVTELQELIASDAECYEELRDALQNKLSERESVDRFEKDRQNAVMAQTAIVACRTGRVLSASALPGSNFIYVQAVGEEVFDVIDDIKKNIDQDVIQSTLVALAIGGIGMTVLIIIVWTVSVILTRPLSWMQRVAWSIVNHADASVVRQSLRVDIEGMPSSHSVLFDKSSSQEENDKVLPNNSSFVKWTPKSEVTELVQEFKHMIRGFSGAGRASSVAKSTLHEVRNTLAWQSDFQPLYEKAIVPEQSAEMANSSQGNNGPRRMSLRNISVQSESGERSSARRLSLRNLSVGSDLNLKGEQQGDKNSDGRLSLRNLSVGSGLNLKGEQQGDENSDGLLSLRNISVGSDLNLNGEQQGDKNSDGLLSLGSRSVGSNRKLKAEQGGNSPASGSKVDGHDGGVVAEGTDRETSREGKQTPDVNDAVAGRQDIIATANNGSNDSPSTGPDCVFRSSNRDRSTSSAGAYAEKNNGTQQTQPATRPNTAGPISTTTMIPDIFAMPQFVGSCHEWRNEGRNMNPPFLSAEKSVNDLGSCTPVGSSLFRWIWILIVIPMIITNAVIVATMSERIGDLLPNWLEHVGDHSFALQKDSLSVASRFAALYAEAVLASPVRDLFLFTRLAEWLFTDAVKRQSTGFGELNTGSDECKVYTEDISLCPWYDDVFENAPCDCRWEVPAPKQCFLMGKNRDTRHMQKLFYAGQRHDADPRTGRRVSTSFPEVDNSPPNTSWWDNVSSVPGAEQGRNAFGYETTYDRLGVFSATSTILFPLYNYRTTLVSKGEHPFLGIYVGMEADGMLAGWAGCRHPSPNYAHFKSTKENHAATVNKTLCPLGKYGYDARCRGWYDMGKKTALQKAYNGTSLYLTPPYEYASSSIKACSATKAIIDPRTGELIGQAMIDFLQTKFEMLHMSLFRSDHSFHFVISPTADSLGGDTVVGPDPTATGDDPMVNFMLGDIGDFVLPLDDVNSTNRKEFDAVVEDMKLGNTCFQNFTRTRMKTAGNGEVFEEEMTYRVAYDPIHARALDSVQCDDYTRGVKASEALVYSVGVARSEVSMGMPFKEFEREASQKLNKSMSIYIAMTVLVSILAIAVAGRISVVVTRPMIILLRVVQNINSGKIEDDIPPLHGGSREVNQVYTSFAKLYKIVRVSNSAFFSRNLHWACHFVRDALKLFTKVDDKKAIAIASANLGSTLLAISCGRPRENWNTCLILDSVCCLNEAFSHFERAVSSGTEDFTHATEMSRKAEFAEQLSDRLFNRGLYFLLSRNDPCATENFEELGLQDLAKAQALDHDVQEYWINNGLLMKKSGVLFDRLMRRLNGLCALLENDIHQHIWDAKSLVLDCHGLLSAAWEEPFAPVFDEMSQIGRLQQLEGALIHLEILRGNEAEAARVAMRMFVEDEFINESSFHYSADALLKYMSQGLSCDSSPSSSWSLLTRASLQRDIRNMLKSCKQTSLQTRKCLFLCVDFSEETHFINDVLLDQLLITYDTECQADDYFGILALNANNFHGSANNNGTIQLNLECKRHKQREQRNIIESGLETLAHASASGGTSSFGSLDFRIKHKAPAKTSKGLVSALDKVLQCDASAMYDSYILYVTDGPKQNWDWKALLTLKSKIEDMNAKRRGDIHLIILDLEFEMPSQQAGRGGGVEEGPDGFSATCRNLCRVSHRSMYIKSTFPYTKDSESTMEESFEEIRSTLSSRNNAAATCSNALLSGITMEKF